MRQARKLLQGGLSGDDQRVACAALDDALARSGAAYRQSAGSGDNPLYGEINGLMFDSRPQRLACRGCPPLKPSRPPRRCIKRGRRGRPEFAARPVVAGDALRCPARARAAGSPSRAGRSVGRSEALEQLKAAYSQAMRSLMVKRSELDSVAKQPRMMADFVDALGLARPHDPGPELVAARLDALARSIDPALSPRRQRPTTASAPAAATPPAKRAEPSKPSRRRKSRRSSSS